MIDTGRVTVHQFELGHGEDGGDSSEGGALSTGARRAPVRHSRDDEAGSSNLTYCSFALQPTLTRYGGQPGLGFTASAHKRNKALQPAATCLHAVANYFRTFVCEDDSRKTRRGVRIPH